MSSRFDRDGESRRSFLRLLGIAGVGAGVGAGAVAGTTGAVEPASEHTVGTLSFYSTASQIAADGESELEDDSIALVRAAETAYNIDEVDSSDDGIIYENEQPPVVSEDGQVVGFGTTEFVADGNGGFDQDNEQFLVNLFEDKIGSEGTVAWDASHEQFWTLDEFESFAAYAADEDFALRSSNDITEGAAKLTFPSAASQVAIGGDAPLTNPEHIVVWAEPTAENVDTEDDGAFIYDDEPIPLVARADKVVGFGTPELINDGNLTDANEQFILNLLTDTIGGEGTVLWDDAHDTFYDSSEFGEFAAAIEGEGYNFEATDDLLDGSTSEIGRLEFFSTSSLIAADGTALTDDSLVAVWAEGTAYTNDEPYRDEDDPDGDGPDIPLVTVDGAVVGVGSDFASDSSDFDQNRTFLVNAWEDRLGGAGTVLYDESHGQNLTLEEFSDLAAVAESRGFTVEAIAEDESFIDRLDDADAVMVATEDDDLANAGGFTDTELDALDDFVADGGGLVLHNTADFDGDSSAELNDALAAVDADFRFNSDQVEDDENRSDFGPFVPQTSNFNEEEYPDFFETEVEDPITIDDADLLAIASPGQSYTGEEISALEAHVRDGGALFLFDESEFTNEETANLNEIAQRLLLPFSFNPDQVDDAENNDGVSFVPTTTNFNDALDVFDGLGGVGLDEAGGLVVTTPEQAFTEDELDALSNFVEDGGALFLFDQSEFQGFEETAHLNEIADALDLAFRFNGDQVEDEQNNVGGVFDIATANYDTEDSRFAPRENGIGIDFERGETYNAKIVQVFDGDTFEVQFDDAYGYTDVVRHIGIDTAETGDAENDPEEWFGIDGDELDHLDQWGRNATEFALDLMAPEGADSFEPGLEGRHVQLEFDGDEPLRGNFGRLLTYMYYDESAFQPAFEDGDFSVDYNRETIEEGYARVYSSGFSRHDRYSTVEARALAERAGVWSATDFDALEPVDNDPVETAFIPRATAITAPDGTLGDSNVVVTGSESADADVGDDTPALVAVDEHARVGAIGGMLIREEYEDPDDDEFPGPGEHDNYPLVANLIDELSTGIGPVFLEGGHNQFDATGSISLERCEQFVRYLEGVGTRLRQSNDLPATLNAEPVRPRAVIITPPATPYTESELDALREFRDNGGAVLLISSARADKEHRKRLNNIAAALGTDLRVSDATVTDPESNVNGDEKLLLTEAFTDSFPVFESADYDGQYVTSRTRALADEADRLNLDGVRTLISDWQDSTIDTATLQEGIDLWAESKQLFPEE